MICATLSDFFRLIFRGGLTLHCWSSLHALLWASICWFHFWIHLAPMGSSPLRTDIEFGIVRVLLLLPRSRCWASTSGSMETTFPERRMWCTNWWTVVSNTRECTIRIRKRWRPSPTAASSSSSASWMRTSWFHRHTRAAPWAGWTATSSLTRAVSRGRHEVAVLSGLVKISMIICSPCSTRTIILHEFKVWKEVQGNTYESSEVVVKEAKLKK